ncbi:UbiA prenyltransferase family [Crucibulum laeve]|uniref:4-hydroxybenzoate polyprenyltransferase, mitochondrial n=1 Tax=Crucibulum laeve TaxID=68775 RepID=A0A5C3LL56_9AGAR|nr:UbiA prenyltransferase family [Crucibulum laeve]
MSLKFTTDAIQPYADLIRFSKPAGMILVFFPFAFSLTMVAYANALPFQDYARLIVVSLLWAFMGRSMACTINDICDRDIDSKVERTKHRPLASGRVSLRGANIFLAVQAFLCLAIFRQSNKLAFQYSIAWFPLIFIYPLTKRITNWPQAWLGIAANWGGILAWTMVSHTVDVKVILPLMVALFAWSMFYDTVYACQDKDDDIKLGIGSSAIGLANFIFPFLCFSGIIFVIFMAIAGWFNNHGLIYFVVSVGGSALEIVWQLVTVNPEDPASCTIESLGRNSFLGYLIWGGLLADYMVRSRGTLV